MWLLIWFIIFLVLFSSEIKRFYSLFHKIICAKASFIFVTCQNAVEKKVFFSVGQFLFIMWLIKEGEGAGSCEWFGRGDNSVCLAYVGLPFSSDTWFLRFRMQRILTGTVFSWRFPSSKVKTLNSKRQTKVFPLQKRLIVFLTKKCFFNVIKIQSFN